MEREEIIEMAEKIGQAIRDTELMRKYEISEYEYANDAVLQDKIREYSVQQEALAQESAKPAPNAFITENINNRLSALYREITGSKHFAEYSSLQDQLRALLADVDNAIMKEVTGEDPAANSGCTHDCSTCSGCH